jgi:hypothetical protein
MRKGLKPRPWSKLKREIQPLFSPDIKIRLHCVAYRMGSQRGSSNLPRYWITLNKEVIWDYQRDFKNQSVDDHRASPDGIHNDGRVLKDIYPYGSDIAVISDVLREYIDTPKAELLTKPFEKDRWGLTDMLRAADRRIGKRRLSALSGLGNTAADAIVAERLKAIHAP